MPVTLGYWKMRGLAQPIRLLLRYTDTKFEDMRYEQGEAPNYSREKWYSVKQTLGLDFPNLPYLFDGDIKLTQSNAILRHIAFKHDLCGKSLEERTRVNIMENEAMDFRDRWVGLTYSSTYESNRADYFQNIKTGRLVNFSKFLGSNPWFAGNEITFVDFVMYELLDQHKMCQPDILDGFDNLKAFIDRFEALPAIKEYMASPEFLRYPVNSKIATWGGK